MSALSVEVPFPVFYDRASEPLENGYVFIGQANLNPQTNPIQVYFDRNLTQLAAQPLRTLSGYISNAGTPAQVFVDATNFSIQVQDKNGTLVYNFPDGTGLASDASGIDYTPGPDSLLLPGGTISIKSALDQITDESLGSSVVGFEAAGGGAVARSTQNKLRDFVSVKDFGAVGDGVTDDTTAFNAAIATGRAVYVPVGDYKVTNVEVINGTRIIGEKSAGVASGGSRILVGTNNSAAFVNNKTSGDVLYDVQISDVQILPATGVTGAKGFFQSDKGAYTAHPIFYNVETWAGLEISYDGFFIFAVWNNCRDGFYGPIPGGQTHQGLRSVPAAYGQTFQTNLNKVFCCQFFRSSASDAAVRIDYGFSWTFDGCDFEDNSTRAFFARGVFGIKFTNCWFEDNVGDYAIFATQSPAPNAQGSRPVSIDNCYFHLDTITIAAIGMGGASNFGVSNSTFVAVPSGVVLANENPQFFHSNIVLSGLGSSGFFTGFQATQTSQILGANTELTVSTKASPYFANANLLPIGPSGLGAANFTINSTGSPTATKANISSGIGLTGQAVEITLSNSENWMYFQIPAKIVPLLQGTPVTLTIGGYGTGSVAEGLTARIWEDVVPSFTNASSGVLSGTLDVSDADLQVASTTLTIGLSTSNLYVGLRVGGANPSDTVIIETMTLYVGEIAPAVPNLH